MIKPYPKYKNTGVEWFGDIPYHWNFFNLKYSDIVIMGQSPSSDDYTTDENDRPFLQGNADFGKLNPTPRIYCEKVNKIAKINDILLSVRAPIGAVNIADKEYGIGRGLCSIRNKNSHYKFLYYQTILKNEEFNSIGTGTTYKAIAVDEIKNSKYLNPPYQEQVFIANFLDKKTKEIDQSISDKKQLIQLYEEEKQAIINNAITKGLDNNAELKETGVEWLGSIPKHWKLTKIKYSSYLKARVGWKGLKSDEFLDDGYAYLVTGTDFKNGKIDWSDCHFIDKDRYEEDKFIQLQNNDLLITKDGTIGKLAIVENLDGYACLNSGVFVMRPLDSMYQVKFLYYILSSKIFESFIDYTSTGATILHLYQNVFNEFQYPLPTVKEQNEIISFIEKSLTKVIDKQLAIEKEIELLKEYKQALIYEAVTGKIDVRDKITD